MDAFSQFFGNDMNWLVPPPSMITKTLIKHIQEKGILIIPEWKKAPYRQSYIKRVCFMNYFKDNYYLPKKDSIFTGAGKNGVFNCILIYSFYFMGINLRKNRKGSDIQWCFFCTSFTQMTMFLLDSKSINTNKSYKCFYQRTWLYQFIRRLHPYCFVYYSFDRQTVFSKCHAMKWANELKIHLFNHFKSHRNG
jgi:hypothetical protein